MSTTNTTLNDTIEDHTEELLNFGTAVKDDEFADELRERLCFGLLDRPGQRPQFPGSQPVSFTRRHLTNLEEQDYYVCEKSDGVRFLLYYACPYGRTTAFLIDRNFQLRELEGLTLPGKLEGSIHEDTLLDGELIYEKMPQANETLSQTENFLFLIFDALLVNGKNILSQSLSERLRYVQNDVVAPFKKQIFTNGYPFRLDMKKMWKPYAIAEILELEIPKLQHGNDGLIFTPVQDPYIPGTCERLLKWKPSEMNSVDFLLKIDPVAPAQEKYKLLVSTKDGGHRLFAYHSPNNEKLDEFNGCIIECRYSEKGDWEFLRPRPDKLMGNNERVAEKIIGSIKDNVTAKELIAKIPSIRRAWKAREVATMSANKEDVKQADQHPWKKARIP